MKIPSPFSIDRQSRLLFPLIKEEENLLQICKKSRGKKRATMECKLENMREARWLSLSKGEQHELENRFGQRMFD